MALFGDRLESDLRTCQKLIESVIESLGLDPMASRLETEEQRIGWGIQCGSARVFIFLRSEGDRNFIRVISPIMKLPEQRTLQLFQRLLVLNAEELSQAAFGLSGDDVVLTIDRSTEDMDRGEVESMITLVGEYADKYDDELKREFH
jgi:hypothetical protein